MKSINYKCNRTLSVFPCDSSFFFFFVVPHFMLQPPVDLEPRKKTSQLLYKAGQLMSIACSNQTEQSTPRFAHKWPQGTVYNQNILQMLLFPEDKVWSTVHLENHNLVPAVKVFFGTYHTTTAGPLCSSNFDT